MHSSEPTLQQLAMRLREATSQTPLRCKEVLEPLSSQLRLAYVEHFEARPGSSLLIDPIELHPEFAELVAEVKREAQQLLDDGQLGTGVRGRAGRMWGWMKRTLAERHHLDWRTPLEMTPGIALD
jgi:hypothetical protein